MASKKPQPDTMPFLLMGKKKTFLKEQTPNSE
jgi:hypothetical protein